jgi:hypothetical protein
MSLPTTLLLFSLLGVPDIQTDIAPHDAYPARRVHSQARTSLLANEDMYWRQAQRISWGPERYRTVFRAVWNEAGLFVRFDARDPAPWYTLTQRDAQLWKEEVVELFIDHTGRGHYREIEINPGNAVCDLAVAPVERRFDARWNHPGLQSRVFPLTDADGVVRGWTAVAFLPWAGFADWPDTQPIPALPPRGGERWHFNVFRVERPGGPSSPDEGALFLAWSPTGESSFHVRSAFRILAFR